MLKETLGNRITEMRKNKGLSQAALGRLVGKSGDVIGRYERGTMSPSIEVVFKLAEALEISIDYLTGKTAIELDNQMLKRLEEIGKMSKEDKSVVYRVVDALIIENNIRNSYKH